MPKESTPAKLSLDFSGVEIRKGAVSDHVPEGDYLAQVDAIVKTHVKDDATRGMLRWTFSIVEPAKYKGKKIVHNTLLEATNLWSLRSLLADLLGGEEKVPQKKLDIPLGVIVSKHLRIGITAEDNEYNNKIRSQVGATFPKADWAERQATATSDDIDEDEEDEDEEDTKSAATSSDDDEDLEEIDVDDI